MSVVIKKNIITMTRGDTLRVKVVILNEDGTEYEPDPDDKIRFALKEHYNDETPIVMVDIPVDTMELHVPPEATKSLPQPSDYVYDIQLTFANGDINTFISSKLKLVEEVE